MSAAAVESTPAAPWPEEDRTIRGAVAKRRREFAVGRTCARRALEQLGLERTGIPVGAMGEPVWPQGVVGSITHSDSHCVVALAREHHIRGLGIDIETTRPCSPAASKLLATDDERRWMQSTTDEGRAATLLLVLKEAVFKTWFPLTGWRLGLKQISVELNPSTEAFLAKVRREPQSGVWAGSIEGRYQLGENWILGAAWVPRFRNGRTAGT